MAAIGLVVLMIAVFGVFVAHGGDLTPVIKAAPWEFAQIFGAAVAASMISNSGAAVGTGFGAVGKVFKGPKYHKDDYCPSFWWCLKFSKPSKPRARWL